MAVPAPVYSRDWPDVPRDGSAKDAAPYLAEMAQAAREKVDGANVPPGEVVLDPGRYRLRTFADGQRMLPMGAYDPVAKVAKGASLRGVSRHGTVLVVDPADTPPPRSFGVDFQETDKAVMPGLGTFNLTVAGGAKAKEMFGVRYGNRCLFGETTVYDFLAGAYFFKDHEVGYHSDLGGFLGAMYFENGLSAGDQKFYDLALEGGKLASVVLASDGMLGGAQFEACGFNSPISFYKEGGEDPVRRTGIMASVLRGCSFEHLSIALFLAEAYFYGGQVNCGDLTLDRCFGSSIFQSRKNLPRGDRGFGTFSVNGYDDVSYPQDALFMGAAIPGIKFVNGRGPLIGTGPPARAMLTAGRGGLTDAKLGDVGGLVAFAMRNGVRLVDASGVGLVAGVELEVDGSEGTLRRASEPFEPDAVLELDLESGGERARPADGTGPFAGVAVEGAPTGSEVATVATSTQPRGRPKLANVADDALVLDAFRRDGKPTEPFEPMKWVAPSTRYPGTFEVTATRGDAVAVTTGPPAGGKVPVRTGW